MNDLEWLAAALEGYSSALVLQLEQQQKQETISTSPSLKQVQDEVIEKYQEAVGHYGKRKVSEEGTNLTSSSFCLCLT
jgi:hypothetical protein